jgi:hypothetical protein
MPSFIIRLLVFDESPFFKLFEGHTQLFLGVHYDWAVPIAEGPLQVDACTLDVRLAFPDFADFSYGIHFNLHERGRVGHMRRDALFEQKFTN